MRMAALGVSAVLLLTAACGDDDGDDTGSTSTTAGDDTTTTTTAPEETTTTAGTAGLEPGDPCSLEEGVPDCIDPDGDGEGTYLIGGAECMEAVPDSGLCTDLDGDGVAGYPDSG